MYDQYIINNDDTICAISTPAGVGGIAVARISGPEAIEICNKMWRGKDLGKVASHTAHLGRIIDSEGEMLDQAVAVVFHGPASYTGQDTVELSIHGSRWIQSQVIARLIGAGCRLAEAGEFTRRAFSAGQFDLAQAEAIADLIASNSKASHRIAMSQMRGNYSRKIDTMRAELLRIASLLELELDFAEEDVEFASRQTILETADSLSSELKQAADSFQAGQAIKEGIPVAIIGRTNAGKSSLLNALVADDRAIVSDIHGTTRDIIEETITCGDYLLRFQDTAGIRHTDDPIEQMGISRSHTAADRSRLVLYVIDSSTAPMPVDTASDTEGIDKEKLIIVANKSDKASIFSTEVWSKAYPEVAIVQVSALKNEGIDQLRQAITHLLDRGTGRNDIIVANARHAQAFSDSAKALDAFARAIRDGIPTDLAAQDLRQAIYTLSTITGSITTPEILQNIFQNFCIGK